MATHHWGDDIAAVYDSTTPAPPVVMIDVLAELARGGPVLELAIGTGRVALPLSERGVAVQGIELSPHMDEQLRAKAGRRTQDEQVAVFANAAAHLAPGGCFVVELVVPQLRRVPPGEPGWIFTLEPDHVGIETLDDTVEQIAWSRHWIDVDGRLVRHDAPYRYVWPAELDLMARLAGFRRRDRWADWDRSPFTADSRSHVTVYEKLEATRP